MQSARACGSKPRAVERREVSSERLEQRRAPLLACPCARCLLIFTANTTASTTASATRSVSYRGAHGGAYGCFGRRRFGRRRPTHAEIAEIAHAEPSQLATHERRLELIGRPQRAARSGGGGDVEEAHVTQPEQSAADGGELRRLDRLSEKLGDGLIGREQASQLEDRRLERLRDRGR